MLKYDTGVDGYVVPLDKAKLEGAPKYVESDVPEYNDDYGRRVNAYYGTPWTGRRRAGDSSSSRGPVDSRSRQEAFQASAIGRVPLHDG